MSTVVLLPGKKYRLLVKGTADIVLGLCTKWVSRSGKVRRIERKMREELEKEVETLTDGGLRALALAYRDWDQVRFLFKLFMIKVLLDDFQAQDWGVADLDVLESRLTLVGLVGIADPLRSGVPTAVAKCHVSL